MTVEALPGRLVRGIVGGEVAGMVSAGVTMWFTSTLPGGKVEMPLHRARARQARSALAGGASADLGRPPLRRLNERSCRHPLPDPPAPPIPRAAHPHAAPTGRTASGAAAQSSIRAATARSATSPA